MRISGDLSSNPLASIGRADLRQLSATPFKQKLYRNVWSVISLVWFFFFLMKPMALDTYIKPYSMDSLSFCVHCHKLLLEVNQTTRSCDKKEPVQIPYPTDFVQALQESKSQHVAGLNATETYFSDIRNSNSSTKILSVLAIAFDQRDRDSDLENAPTLTR